VSGPLGLLRVFLALLVLWISGAAQAQLSGFAGFASENNFRGRDLSTGDPVVQAGAAYDLPSGWFAGASATEVRFSRGDGFRSELIGYGGYAQRIDADWSWEGGITTSRFASSIDYNYSELFLGAAFRDWNARVYYSPNYFSQSVRTLYAEVNGSIPLADRFNLIAHVGALDTSLDRGGANARQLDMQLGVAANFNGISTRLSWVDTNRLSYLYPFYGTARRQHWLLNVIAAF
jgi:uncharacterized protein (TIGR02001 family)